MPADPTLDITNSGKIDSVIVDGVILDRDALLKAPR